MTRILDSDSSGAYWLYSNGREAVIVPLTYGRARIVIGEQGSTFYDDGW